MRRVVLGVALLAALAVLARVSGLTQIWSLLHAPGPPLSGELRAAGLSAPVRVARDRHGYVHVAAQSEPDAFFGLGLAHAQDRFWQMELLRRAARGRLAELFGAGSLGRDRLARTVGLGEAADAEAERLPKATRALLEAYAAGVNAWLAETRSGRAEPAGELRWLGVSAEDWRVSDTLAVLRLRSWSLSHSLDASLLLDRLVRERGSSASQLFFPAPQPGLQAGAARSLLALALDADGLARSAGLGGASGSLGFLVGSSRSRAGRPLLAVDPHAELGLPPRFYVAHLETPERSLSGATWPGIPVFWIGTNRRIAWGQVALRAIVSDLFDETLDARDPTRYYDGGHWVDAERQSGSIAVRAGRAEPIEVVRTRHGPLLASARPDDPALRSYALRWTGADRRSGIDALLELQRASGWTEFRNALRSYPAPPATFLYADVDGSIGTQVAGALPVRPIDTKLLPVAAEYDWTGFVPFDALPSRSGAELSWVAVSLQGDGSAFARPTEWLWPDGSAAERVRERLRDASRLDLAGVLEIQHERVSADGPRRARALLSGVQPRTRGGQQIREFLLGWDGSTAVDSAGAAVYHVFRQELTRRLLGARFGDASAFGDQIASAEPVPGVLLERFMDRASADGGPELVAAALEDSWEWFATHLSSNPRRWLWGELRGVRFAHAFEELGSGGLHWIGTLFGIGPLAVPGDPDSPWTIHHRSLLKTGVVVGPGLRYAIDLADVYHARIELAGGQSGHPGSPNYRDGLDDWLRARPGLLRTHPSDIEDNQVGVWRLEPQAAQPAAVGRR